MCKKIGKKVFSLLLISTIIALLVPAQAFADKKKKQADPSLVKEEEGYYYGYGKAATKEEAQLMARRDLIENALTLILREKNPKASRVSISDEVANSRFLNLKPYQSDKPGTNICYRVKIADWEKDEKAFTEKLRAELLPYYDSFASGKDIAKKIDDAIYILTALSVSGETDLLTIQAEGTELFSEKVEAGVKSMVAALDFVISVPDGLTGPDTVYSVTVTTKGKPVKDLTVRAIWSVAELPITVSYSYSDIPESVSFVKTDANGTAVIEYPVSEDFQDKPVALTVSTAFSTSQYATSSMKKLDASSSVDACYYNLSDKEAFYASIVVAPGEFNAGCVPQDRKAFPGREAAHTETTGAYAMDVAPVTNEQYAVYLYVTRSEEYPAYFDNTDYNQAQQPVIGVSKAEAEAYAAWLSSALGVTYRLPTEAEWEKAARAGEEVIFPWGDDSPDKSKKANCAKNGKFKFTSPVGAFESGTNAWGFVDMSGNVWEMTSTVHVIGEGEEAESTEDVVTLKGGSFMDGASELRISNFKNVNIEERSADTGFRLVRDVEWEEPSETESEEEEAQEQEAN